VSNRIFVGRGQDWFGFRNTRLIQFGRFRRTLGGEDEVGDGLLSGVGGVDG